MNPNNKKTSREFNDMVNRVDNLIWEIVEILVPHSYIDPIIIHKIRNYIMKNFKDIGK